MDKSKIILLAAYSLFFIPVLAQRKPSLEKKIIWEMVFPGDKQFDEEDRLVRHITDREMQASLVEYTEVDTVFYYKVGLIQKALVVLNSYKFDGSFEEGVANSCHVCGPDCQLATFTFENDTWRLTGFIQKWEKGSLGSWGTPAREFGLQVFKNINCLVLKTETMNRGQLFISKLYFDIETLRQVK